MNIAGRLTFGQETITATIPLAMLGGDDGTVRFKVRGSYVDTTLNSVVYEDWLTDAGELAVSVK